MDALSAGRCGTKDSSLRKPLPVTDLMVLPLECALAGSQHWQ